MKRTHKRILSAALAAALMLCSFSQNTPFRLWNPPTAVQAAGKVTLNEKTGVLTLSGEVTKEQIWAFRENQKVTNIVAAEGTVLPIDCTGLFARMNCEVRTFLFFFKVSYLRVFLSQKSRRVHVGCTEHNL